MKKNENIFSISWELSKMFFANALFCPDSWTSPINLKPVRIAYILVVPLFIIILVCLSIYFILDFLYIIKLFEWLFSSGD